jgi:protocatechuate 3,4-dioxygenase beta subunit
MTAILTRRAALAGLAAAGGFAEAAFAQACRPTPRSTEGPFYFDPKLERSDITEGRPGAPLELALRVVQAGGCAPLEGARVDIWHADALGDYSARGETFMRGAQLTDAAGDARFRTIWPGWYRGRTTHVHFKVWRAAREALTGQLYFPDEISDRLYREAAPYNARPGRRDIPNADDGLFRRSGSSTLAQIQDKPDRLIAALTLVLS